MGDEDRGPVSLAEKLDRLFQERSRERGKSLSANDVATDINIRAGEQVISGNYIWQLRKGKRDNPTKRHIEALAEYFGVPAAYFHDQQDAGSGGAAADRTDQPRSCWRPCRTRGSSRWPHASWTCPPSPVRPCWR